jgi:periplasmic protein TonB
MYEPNGYESDEELEQALYAAFVREPAPGSLISRVEQRLFVAQGVPAVPSFRLLTPSLGSAWSSFCSIAAHAAVFALVALPLLYGKRVAVLKTSQKLTQIDVQAYVPANVHSNESAGGGGGGSHDILPVSKGRLPKPEQQPLAPPLVAVNEHPKLPVEPAIVLPKDFELPTGMPNLGDPRNIIVGPASNGIGEMAGMGSGSRGGIGAGIGNGYGPGEGGGYGGDAYQVGGGVLAPKLIYAVDPEFSDEARRAKFQGTCVVGLIVDAQGNPQAVHVVNHLGMGLDEKAVAAVRQYKFKPATLQGKPVPVVVTVEVIFRIF